MSTINIERISYSNITVIYNFIVMLEIAKSKDYGCFIPLLVQNTTIPLLLFVALQKLFSLNLNRGVSFLRIDMFVLSLYHLKMI